MTGTNDHWCKVSQWEAENCSQYLMDASQCDELKRNLSTPVNLDEYDLDPQCFKYNLSGISLSDAYESNNLSTYIDDVIPCDEGWHFERNNYRKTITEEWELVCDRSSIPNVLQSVNLAGVLLGCILSGAMADKIGRFYTIAICTVLTGVVCAITALSSNIYVYAMLRFTVGATTYGASLVCFVYGTEVVSADVRVYFGVFLWYFFALGYFVLAVIGRYVTSWRIQMVIYALPFLFLTPFIGMLSESPRWLLSKKKFVHAEKVIRKIARVNGKTLPDELMSTLKTVEDVPIQSASYLDILRHRILIYYTINLIYNWFVQSFVYYGLSLGTSSLGVNNYIAFCLSGAVEIPAYTASMFSMTYLGRKISTGGLMILAGLACFATILAPLGPIRVIFGMIGKFAITASFANIYVHTAEIFPTPLRVLGVGTCSIAARVGGIIAPLVLVLEKGWKHLPLVCFAASSVLAGLLVFFLPETKGLPMPDTIEDTLSLRKRKYRPVNNNQAASEL
ncbi:putative organic cation transporter protein-like [Apostichopus japonicus]|uniref:Putative organic cation transporter protein-like n=1 Tax=Stichopus japonicus TaxID=307972 RepID=A0A2G8LA09_STIJA|nr:putative organic cation transporter protein-like [Apostichopus japonicus]